MNGNFLSDYHYTPRSGSKLVGGLKDQRLSGALILQWESNSLHVITAGNITRLNFCCDGDRRRQVADVLQHFRVPNPERPFDEGKDIPLEYLLFDRSGQITVYCNAAHAPAVWNTLRVNIHPLHKLQVGGDTSRWKKTFGVDTPDVKWEALPFSRESSVAFPLDGDWGSIEIPKNTKDSVKAIFGEDSLKAIFHEKSQSKGKDSYPCY